MNIELCRSFFNETFTEERVYKDFLENLQVDFLIKDGFIEDILDGVPLRIPVDGGLTILDIVPRFGYVPLCTLVRIYAAIGGVASEKGGFITPKYCAAKLLYNEDLKLISVDLATTVIEL